MAPTQRSTVFLHSRLERTPWWHWMCVFSVRHEAADLADLVGRLVRYTLLWGSHMAHTSEVPHQCYQSVRFSPIGESTAHLIVLPSVTRVYVVSWHYLLHLHCPIQINLTLYADSTNSGSGVLSMTNDSASFAAESLMAGKFRCKAAQAGMDHNG